MGSESPGHGAGGPAASESGASDKGDVSRKFLSSSAASAPAVPPGVLQGMRSILCDNGYSTTSDQVLELIRGGQQTAAGGGSGDDTRLKNSRADRVLQLLRGGQQTAAGGGSDDAGLRNSIALLNSPSLASGLLGTVGEHAASRLYQQSLIDSIPAPSLLHPFASTGGGHVGDIRQLSATSALQQDLEHRMRLPGLQQLMLQQQAAAAAFLPQPQTIQDPALSALLFRSASQRQTLPPGFLSGGLGGATFPPPDGRDERNL